jgi:hypothetical protein
MVPSAAISALDIAVFPRIANKYSRPRESIRSRRPGRIERRMLCPGTEMLPPCIGDRASTNAASSWMLLITSQHWKLQSRNLP